MVRTIHTKTSSVELTPRVCNSQPVVFIRCMSYWAQMNTLNINLTLGIWLCIHPRPCCVFCHTYLIIWSGTGLFIRRGGISRTGWTVKHWMSKNAMLRKVHWHWWAYSIIICVLFNLCCSFRLHTKLMCTIKNI